MTHTTLERCPPIWRTPARYAAWAMLSLCAQAQAQVTATPAPDSPLQGEVHDLALAASLTQAPAAARVEVSVGQLDPRLRLAPCARVQPYLPDGVRLWGRSRVGVRCTAGPVKWNVYLPITVKVYGKALVAARDLAAGGELADQDLAQAEVDLAEDPSSAVGDSALAVGRTLTRSIKQGQSVRQSHLKARQWFSAGETVTVVTLGPGFSVSGEAQALNNGIEGEPVRVRTEGGRVLTGQAVGLRRVELAL